MSTDVQLTEIQDRVARIVGNDRAATLTDEILEECGLVTVETPNHLLTFATQLESRGGAARIVARSLKTQAMLRGATA